MKNKTNIIFYIISALLIGIVAATIFMPAIKIEHPERFNKLPLFNAILNGLSAISLLISYSYIKKGNKKEHVRFIFLSLLFTFLFLISYLFYHFIHTPTKFGGNGTIKAIYLFILLTHIVLAASMIPLIMFTLKNAFQKKWVQHKKLARFTFPIWLYVSLTGVLVYLLNLFNGAY